MRLLQWLEVMKQKLSDLGGFEINKKSIKVSSINNNGPKLIFTIDRVKAVNKVGKYMKFAQLQSVKNYILDYPLKITEPEE